jgi:hypothetical protein
LVNPLGPGFDAVAGVRPLTASGEQPPQQPSDPTDSVSSTKLDPYARMEQMRKQGLGSTPIGPLVAQQIQFGSAPQTNGAPKQEPQPPVESQQQAQAPAPPPVETQTPAPTPVEPKKPIVVREPVSEEMREMVDNMRRAGADIPEPPQPPPPPKVQAEVVPTEAPVVEPQAETPDPWSRLQEMHSIGMGST